MKVLNIEWFNDIGIVTIDNGYEIKSYMKQVKGLNKETDIQEIISLGVKVYPERLQKIVNLHKE